MNTRALRVTEFTFCPIVLKLVMLSDAFFRILLELSCWEINNCAQEGRNVWDISMKVWMRVVGSSEKRVLRECFGNNLLSIAVQKTKNLNLNFFCVTVFFLQRPQLIQCGKVNTLLSWELSLHFCWQHCSQCIVNNFFLLFISISCLNCWAQIHSTLFQTEMASQQTEAIHTTEWTNT